MRWVLSIACGVLLAAAPNAGAVVFPPAQPPPLPSKPPDPLPAGSGTLRFAERFDPSKGVPVEGYSSFVTIKRLASGQVLPDRPLPIEDMQVPRGRYEVTSYWRTGSGTGTLDPASNHCTTTFEVKSGFRNNLFIARDARGCTIKLATERKCKAKPKARGEKRRCRKVRKVILPKPVSPNPGSPPHQPGGKPIPVPTFSITPNGHDFGNIPLGSTSPPQTFTVKNVSDGPLGPVELDLNWDSADFLFSADTCTGTTLAPAQECTFNLSFQPIVTGWSIDYLSAKYPGGQSASSVFIRGTGV